jgi:hypothetical protein
MGPTSQDVTDYLDLCTFSDWYKDVNGFRPRGYTLEQARAWMASESANPTPIEDDEDFWVAPAEGEGWSYNGSTGGLSLEA